MAVNIVPVPRELQVQDLIPNYTYKLDGVEVNEEESERQKRYLDMFLEENFDIIKQQMSSSTVEQLNAYLKGSKDMLAFVYLWIDSLNTKEEIE